MRGLWSLANTLTKLGPSTEDSGRVACVTAKVKCTGKTVPSMKEPGTTIWQQVKVNSLLSMGTYMTVTGLKIKLMVKVSTQLPKVQNTMASGRTINATVKV